METTTTPRCCETCLYMATHEKCNASKVNDPARQDCLVTKPGATPRPGSRWTEPDYEYRNYVEAQSPMEQMDRLHAMQVAGTRSIVIGGSGEAEVNARQTPQECSNQLHYVAEECGYSAGRLQHDGEESSITIYTERQYRIVWKSGKLDRIMRQVWSNPEYPARAELIREVVWWSAQEPAYKISREAKP